MANSRSARKRIRSNERKRLRNRAVRSMVRTEVNQARHALRDVGTGESVEQELRAAIKALDRAAEKGILHRNNAARRKSRLMTMAARLARAAGAGEAEAAAARSVAAGGEKGRAARSGTRAAAKPAKKGATKAASTPRSSAARTRAATSKTSRSSGGSGSTKS